MASRGERAIRVAGPPRGPVDETDHQFDQAARVHEYTDREGIRPTHSTRSCCDRTAEQLPKNGH